MGKRHNTLSDDIFRNSKYIKALERELGIEDFKKEYKYQYELMLDIFKTLIIVNNIIFADSNKTINDKVEFAVIEIEKCIYKDLPNDDETYFYSTRTIKGLIDSYTRHLFYRFIEWKNHLNDVGTLDFVKRGVEEEMTRLENIGFDEVEKGDLHYEKNKNSDYKIYISKLSSLYTENKAILKQYKDDFNNDYGIDLNDEQLHDIVFIYNMIACANNGITNILLNSDIQSFNLSDRSSAEDYYKAYLTSLHIDIKDNDIFKRNSEEFLKSIIDLTQNNLDELIKQGKMKDISVDDFINNYDFYYFIFNIIDLENGKKQLLVKTDLINKIVKDLKEVYSIIESANNNKEEKQVLYQNAFDKIQTIIERNKRLFERLS